MKKQYRSIRTKFVSVYLGLMLLVMILISVLVMKFVAIFFIQQQQKSLDQTRGIINTLLLKSDFRSSSVDSTLDTTARAMGISIWLITEPKHGNVDLYCYGSDSEYQEAHFGQMNSKDLQILKELVQGVEFVRNGQVFIDMFDGEMLSIGYMQPYITTSNVMGVEITSEHQGAVVLNISMEQITHSGSVVFGTIFIITILVSGIAIIAILILTGSIIRPIRQMQSAARAIAEGDFEKHITVNTKDEIGDLAQSINTMTEELRSLEEMRRSFIANISHDFRSPLTSMKGFLEAMLDGTIPEEMYPRYMQIVLDETNRLTKMTNNILDLTKMESGQDEIVMTNFDINEMIIKILIGLEQRIESKHIHMDLRFSQEKLYVSADQSKIQRVIYNLVDNALKFTEDGDSIMLSTTMVDKKVRVEVGDTGVGIDAKSLPHIFERFNKGDKSRGTDKKGNGLGLAIVKQILIGHGEDITVSSKEGEGTVFTFTLNPAYRLNLVEKK